MNTTNSTTTAASALANVTTTVIETTANVTHAVSEVLPSTSELLQVVGNATLNATSTVVSTTMNATASLANVTSTVVTSALNTLSDVTANMTTSLSGRNSPIPVIFFLLGFIACMFLIVGLGNVTKRACDRFRHTRVTRTPSPPPEYHENIELATINAGLPLLPPSSSLPPTLPSYNEVTDLMSAPPPPYSEKDPLAPGNENDPLSPENGGETSFRDEDVD